MNERCFRRVRTGPCEMHERGVSVVSWALAWLVVLPAACRSPEQRPGSPERPLRVAVRASAGVQEHLTPLSYRGGFLAKTLVYETLLTRDPVGRLAPGLAESWQVLEGGRGLRLRLRSGARFHDGTPVTARAVELHFRRWVGLPEHAWLGSSERIQSMVIEDEHTLRIELSEPWPLLDELCAINPCAIQAPGAIDRQGEFARPLGSGPYRFVSAGARGQARFERFDARADVAALELVPFGAGRGDAAVDALLRGRVDLVADGWYELVPRERVAELRGRADVSVLEGPGSSVWYLSFRLSGPTAAVGVRRALRDAINRAELAEEVEFGHADPAFSWAAPSMVDWPRSAAAAGAAPGPAGLPALRLVVARTDAREQRLGRYLSAAWRRAGIEIEVLELDPDSLAARLDSGDYDVRIEHTWGVPYDPWISLLARFAPPPARESAASPRHHGVDDHVSEWCARLAAAPTEAERLELAEKVQRLLDLDALVIPLLVPRRLAVVRAVCADLELDHDLYRLPLAHGVDAWQAARAP